MDFPKHTISLAKLSEVVVLSNAKLLRITRRSSSNCTRNSGDTHVQKLRSSCSSKLTCVPMRITILGPSLLSGPLKHPATLRNLSFMQTPLFTIRLENENPRRLSQNDTSNNSIFRHRLSSISSSSSKSSQDSKTSPCSSLSRSSTNGNKSQSPSTVTRLPLTTIELISESAKNFNIWSDNLDFRR
ncbi:hypothetical protein HK096_003606 [Nowakowskiella sp. JEL0078]|nr:hypothetical protein HK096_003606 [Nowakowskiella sp. JEL0078]